MTVSLAAKVFLASGLSYEAPSPAVRVPAPGLDGPPLLVWQAPLPGTPPATATRSETASPAIDARHLFVGHSGANALLVLNRQDGSVVHTLPTHAPVASAAVLSETFVYVADAAGYTSAFRRDALATLTPAWSHFSGAPILASPTLAGNTLYVTNVDDLVYALDATSGELKWRHAHKVEGVRAAELELFGAPAAVVAGDTVLVGFSDGFLTGLGAADGTPRWSAEVGAGAYPDLIAPATPVGPSVVVGGYSEPLVSLDPATRAVQWRVPVGSASAFRLDGELLWHGGTDGVLRKIEARTGNVLWQWDSLTGGALTTPLPTLQGVLVASSEGSMYLVDTTTGTEKWSFDPGVLITGIGAAPVVDGDEIYVVSNAGVLYALRGGEGNPIRDTLDWVTPPTPR